jgi:transcriptional/translational regulatory protein YebC/TACO1
MTDNKTRTVADVRHAFAKNGGNLGTDGSVSFLFKHCGQMIFAPGTDENALMKSRWMPVRRIFRPAATAHRSDHRAA